MANMEVYVDPDTLGDEVVTVYPMKQVEQAIWEGFLERVYATSTRRAGNHLAVTAPAPVQDVIDKWETMKTFEMLEVWASNVEVGGEKALVGIANGKRYLLARWADGDGELASMGEIVAILKKQWRKKARREYLQGAVLTSILYFVGAFTVFVVLAFNPFTPFVHDFFDISARRYVAVVGVSLLAMSLVVLPILLFRVHQYMQRGNKTMRMIASYERNMPRVPIANGVAPPDWEHISTAKTTIKDEL